ncbi:LamG-like jellyroll fold domain-containing protein [Neptunicella sp.]|uniref:LamG-like jellyroll fold domain-containing protein n=1 Tax=Neptunicella sp. TaxID=2125986 RepID=UPI003F691FF6
MRTLTYPLKPVLAYLLRYYQLLLLLTGLLGSSVAYAEMSVEQYQMLGNQRVNRTTFEYEVKLVAFNAGTTATNIKARISSDDPAIVFSDNEVSFADLDSQTSALSSDSFRVRIDRQTPFSTDKLNVAFSFEQAGQDEVTSVVAGQIYQLENLDSNTYLTVETNAVLNSYVSINNPRIEDLTQLWTFIEVAGQPGYYNIKSLHSAYYLRCFDPDPARTDEGNGANVTVTHNPQLDSAMWVATFLQEPDAASFSISCKTGDFNLRGYDPYGNPKQGDGAYVTTQSWSDNAELKWRLHQADLPAGFAQISVTPGLGKFQFADVSLTDLQGNNLNPGHPGTGITGVADVLIPTNLTTPVMIQVSGNSDASYYDFLSNSDVPLGEDERLSAVINPGAAEFGVTALTEIAANIISRSETVDAGLVDQVNQAVTSHYSAGLNSILIAPTIIDDLPAAGSLGNSQADVYTANLIALANSADHQNYSSIQITNALAEDSLDGSVDGKLESYAINNLPYGESGFSSVFLSELDTAMTTYTTVDINTVDSSATTFELSDIQSVISNLDISDLIASYENQATTGHRNSLYALWDLNDVQNSGSQANDNSGQQRHLTISDWDGLSVDGQNSPVAKLILDDPAAQSDLHGAVRGNALANNPLDSSFVLHTALAEADMAAMQEMTISMWVRPADNQKGYLWSLQDDNNKSIGLQMYNNERLRFYSESSTPRMPGFVTTSVLATPKFNAPVRNDDITAGWMQVAVVLKAQQGVKFYLDGELVGEVAMPALDLTGIRDFRLGQTYEASPTRAFVGLMDQVRIYQKALTTAELLSDYIEDSTHGPWAFEIDQPQDANGLHEGDTGVQMVTITLDSLQPTNGLEYDISQANPAGAADVMSHGVHNVNIIKQALFDAKTDSSYAGKIVKIQFPANGEYYVGDSRYYAGDSITMTGMHDVIIDGNGAKLIHVARRGFFSLYQDANNQPNQRILIRNLTLDYFNEVYPFQTKVSIEKLGNNQVRLTPLSNAAYDYKQYIDNIGAMITWAGTDTDYPSNKVGVYSGTGSSLLLPFENLYALDTLTGGIVGGQEEANIGSYPISIETDGTAVLDLSSKPSYYSDMVETRDYMVAHYGGKRAFSVQQTEHLSLENVQVISSPGNALAAFGGVRYLKLEDFVSAKDPDETDPNAVVATKADGVFLFHNRGNYLFKNIRLEGGTEDRMVIRELTGFNPQYVSVNQMVVCYASNARPASLALPGDIYELRDKDMNFIWRGEITSNEVIDGKKDDYLNGEIDPETGEEILQVDPRWALYKDAHYSNGTAEAKACSLLTFNQPVPGDSTAVYRTDTMVHHFNPDGSRFSSNYILIGSSFGENRGNGAKFSSPHALIAHNRFANSTHQGVKFPLMIDMKACTNSWGNNGSGARNVIFSDNSIQNVGRWIAIEGSNFNTMPPAALSIFTNRYSPQTQQNISCSHMTLDAGQNPVDIQWQSHFVIKDNRIADSQWGGISIQSSRYVLAHNNELIRTNQHAGRNGEPAYFSGAGALQATQSKQVVAWDNKGHELPQNLDVVYFDDPLTDDLYDFSQRAYQPQSNLLLNGNYENIPAGQETATEIQDIPGWTEWNDLDASFVQQSEFSHSGQYQLVQQSSSGHYVSSKQLVSGLTNGTYRLEAWVKRNGDFDLARLRVLDHGSSEINLNIEQDNNWHKLVLDNIPVTSGQLQVVLTSKTTQGGASVKLDDVLLKRIE